MSIAASSGKGPHTCESCDRSSVLGHVSGWGLCPACRRSRPDLRIGSVVFTILLVAVAVVVGRDIEPGGRLAALLALWPIGIVNAVTHESTHALVAVLLGWRVHILAIGTGQPWLRLRVGGTLLVLCRRFFAGGHCLASPEAAVPSRRAIALFVGAPMVMHAVVAVVAVRWVSSDSLGGVVAAMFAASNLLYVAWNAWPRDVPHRGMGMVTDGKALLEVWRTPETTLAKWRFAVALGPYQARLLEGEPEEAARLVEHALPHVAAYAKATEEMRPRAVRALADRDLAAQGLFRGREHEEYVRGSLFVTLDRLDETLAISERGVAAATSEEARALWQACVALALLMMGKDLDRAEEAARWAYERLPWVPFVETAWGMVRIERGDAAGGLEIFDRVAKIDPEGRTAGLRAAWTVAARAALGKPAREMPAELRAPNVWPACRRRVERALAP